VGKDGAAINLDALERACTRLGEIVVDPSFWPSVMADICRAVGASGAALLQSDVRTPDIPRTPSVDEMFSHYFQNGWHTRDVRAQRAVPLLLSGSRIIIDQDIFTLVEMRREQLYGEALLPFGFQWFAAVGFRAGPALWGLSIQRTTKEGPFARRDKAILSDLSRKLTEVASLSHAVGRVALSSATNALNSVHVPAIAVDMFGNVLDANEAAQVLFDQHVCIRKKHLVLADKEANSCLKELLDRLRYTPEHSTFQCDPIVIRRPNRQNVVIHALPAQGAAQTPFLGARALLTFTSIESKPGPQPALLSKVFGLTPAEARLASIIAEGLSPEQAADQLKTSRETVRNQLRAIFAKTATHRQSELVALLSRIRF
jgi:DNA-binding CsgD family transcriptional regulator